MGPHLRVDILNKNVKVLCDSADKGTGTPAPRIRAMAAPPTSRLHARLLLGAVAVVIAALFPAVASATTTSQARASITNATTGLSDASSIAPRGACGVPKPGHAACLAQFLAVRQTGQRVHPHLLPAASPNGVHLVRARSRASARSAAVTAAANAVPAPQPGGPAYLQQAYDVAALAQIAGGNRTIAIVDAYDSPTAESDLATYRSNFKLPSCTTANGCFQKVNEYGHPSPLPSSPPAGTGWGTEIALDLDAVSALCPNCRIVLVEANSDAIVDLALAQSAAAHLSPAPDVITDSWGAVPASQTSQLWANAEQAWLQSPGRFTFPGIATVAASGDFGYLGAGQNRQCASGNTQATCNVYPAALPGVTAAGGTTMLPANGIGTGAARGLGESAWSGSGSGCDTTEAKPSWQTDTGCTGRSYNDLSADADPLTGIDVYNTSDGGWEIVGGTSLASPLIASYYALVGAGTSPSWAYSTALSQPDVFNDPVSGSNGTCNAAIVYICNATKGYDGSTGLGTISGAVVAGAPGIAAPGFGATELSYTQGLTSTSATLQGGVYPNGNDTTYFWQYGTTTSYGQTTPATGIGSGTAPVAVTDTLTGLSSGTTYHYRLVAQSPDAAKPGQFLTQYGYDFTLTTSSTGNAAGSGSGSGSGGGSGSSGGSGSGSGSGASGTTTTTGTTTGTGTTPVTHAPAAPSLGSLRIVALGSRSATVSETLNTGGGATRYYLAYGTTPKLTQRTSVVSSSKSGTVTWHLRGLRAGKIYYLQAVAANGGGARRSGTVRVKTSPVSVGKITAHGNQLLVSLRCRGSARCPVKLAVKIGKKTVASGRATVRGNHSATITLKLDRAAAARAAHGKSTQATLSAVSVWNGYAATVAAKFRLALS
jgi:hypothetical protein